MACHGGPDIIEDNLVFYVDAANTKSYSGTGTTWNDISYNGNNGTIDGATFKSPLGVAQSFTCILNADYNVSWSQYSCMGGSDRNGTLSGGDPAININLGDTITFDLSTHSGNNSQAGLLWITTTRPSLNPVTNPTATNNGASHTDISWTPSQAGTYYYQNASHSNMWGYIYVTDKSAISPCISFDGTNDYATFDPGSDIAFGTGTFAVEFWANFDGEGSFYFIDTRNSGQTTSRWAFFINSNERTEWYTGSTSYFQTDATLQWSTGNVGWNHIVFSREGTGSNQFKVYFNGEYKASVTDTTDYSNSSTEASLGRRYNNTEFLDGEIAVCRIYKGKGLTAAEVKQNYNAFKRRFGL